MNSIGSFRLCSLSDKELLNRVDKMTDEMYRSGKIPPRHIPAQPNNDYDLLVAELIIRYNNLISDKNEHLNA